MKRSRAILFARPSPSRITHRLLSKLKARDLNEIVARLKQASHKKPIDFSDLCVRGLGKVWLKSFCEEYRLTEEFKEFEMACRPSYKWIFATYDDTYRPRKALTIHLNKLLKSAKFFGYSEIVKQTQYMLDNNLR
jgi:hypothetical protein